MNNEHCRRICKRRKYSPKNDFEESRTLAYYEFKELVHSRLEAFGIQIEEPKN